jgi:hypothetical protein
MTGIRVLMSRGIICTPCFNVPIYMCVCVFYRVAVERQIKKTELNERFEIFTAMKIHVMFLRVTTRRRTKHASEVKTVKICPLTYYSKII